MRTTLLLLLLVFSFHMQSQTFQKKELLASCCETEGGKCTGSSSCTVCKNCVRCKHCSSGGSCGVCAGTQTNHFSSSSKKKSTTTKVKTSTVKTDYDAGKLLTVIHPTLNLRKEPKSTGIIIQKLAKGDELTLIEKKGDWIKVLVNKNQKIGWVMRKYVK